MKIGFSAGLYSQEDSRFFIDLYVFSLGFSSIQGRRNRFPCHSEAVEVLRMTNKEQQLAEDLSRMWASLSLSETEETEIEIQTQAWEVGAHRGKTCVVGKLIADHLVSKELICATLWKGWKPTGTPSFKVLGDNLFLVEFVNMRDKQRVLEGRPWVFEGNLFAIEDYDGLTSPANFSFDKASFWVRMLNLPLACMSLVVGQQIGSSLGHVEEVDVDEGGMGWGAFLRVMVTQDLHKPLVRGKMLKFNGSTTLVGFQYERLSKFCFRCGVIKHGVTGCSAHNGSRKQNGPVEHKTWLRAPSPKRVFGGRLGSKSDRREHPRREYEGENGRSEQTRWNIPERHQFPMEEPKRGGEASGTVENGEDSFMESESRGNKCFPNDKPPVTEEDGGNHGGFYCAGNQGKHIPENIAKESRNNTEGFGGQEIPQTQQNLTDDNEEIKTAKSFNSSHKEKAKDTVLGGGHVQVLVHGNNVQANVEGKRTESHDAGVGQQGVGTYLTMADVEHRMKGNGFTEISERRRASDPTWVRKTKDRQGM